LFPGLDKPCSSVKAWFIDVNVNWVSKKVVDPKDEKTCEKSEKDPGIMAEICDKPCDAK
jgi:hypothetical protein